MTSDQREKQANGGKDPTYIVGIGASAGGLQALERFFAAVRPDGKTAYVVVQHLSPDFKSMMGEILSRLTDLTVRSVTQDMVLEPDTITLNVPRADMVLREGRLSLSFQTEEVAVPLPIDIFFESLAKEKGEQGIALILSGTGRDGARGSAAVAQRGGLVLTQDLESALFGSMPLATNEAVPTAHQQTPEEMAETIEVYTQGPATFWKTEGGDLPFSLLDGENSFSYLLSLLQNRYNVDFSRYKPQTLVRRLQRRITLDQIDGLERYVRQAQSDPNLLDQLYRDMLIDVTRFFRDEEAYTWLENNVIPQIIGAKIDGERVRVWSAACSSGEEAYSLAMLFLEEIERQGRDLELRLFATDIHPDSIAVASAGLYPPEAVENLSHHLRQKYFNREAERYRVKKELRQKIFFSVHNLLADPHFTQQDMISCRNMLIYVRSEAQADILQRFANDLVPNGILFLGPSEHLPGRIGPAFDVLSRHWRIFQKIANLGPSHVGRVSGSPIRVPPHLQDQPSAAPMVRLGWEPALLRALIPAGYVCDQTATLKEVYGDGHRFLRFSAGRVDLNLPELLPESLGIAVRNGLGRAQRENQETKITSIQVKLEEDETQIFSVRVIPFKNEEGEHEPLFLILLDEERTFQTLAPVDVKTLDDQTFGAVQSLKLELAFTRESLQGTLEELETANEELQSSNEELTGANEELQSTNEELSSVNEELYTVNAEYQEQNRVLNRLFNDSRNLLRASEVLVIFLDEALRLREITPACYAMFGLVETDIGRPISQFTPLSGAGVEQLRQLAEAALRGTPGQVEVVTPQGTPLYLNAIPYFGELDEVTGVVLNFVDLNEIRRAEAEKLQTLAELEKSEARYRGLIETQRELIARINPHDHTYTFVNPARAAFYGKTPEELIGHSSLRPENKESHAAIMARRAEVVRTKKSLPPHVDTLQHPSGEIHHIYWQTVPILNENGEVVEIQGVGTDITARVQAEDRLVLSEARYRSVIETQTEMITRWRPDDFVVTYANPAYEANYGADLVGQSLLDFVEASYATVLQEKTAILCQTGEPQRYREDKIAGDGTPRTYAWIDSPIFDSNGKIVEIQGVGRDITDQVAAQRALEAANRQINLINDNLPIWISEIDTEHRFLYMNRFYIETFGLQWESGRTPYVRDVLGESLYQKNREFYQRALSGETIDYVGQPVIDGQTRYAQMQLIPNIERDEVKSFFVLGFDITREVEARNELRKAYDRINLINDHLPLWIAEIDREYRYRYLNRYYQEMLGVDISESLGMSVRTVLGDAVYERGHPYYERALAGETVEYVNTTGDQSEYKTLITLVPNRESDQIDTFFLFGVDISELSQTQQLLRETDQRLTALSNALPLWIMIVDREHRLVYLNRYFTNLIEPEALETIIGKPAEAVIDTGVLKQIMPSVARALEGEIDRFMGKIRLKNGTEVTTSVYVAPYPRGDREESDAVFVMMLNMDELKQMRSNGTEEEEGS